MLSVPLTSKIVKFFTKSATNGSRPFQPSGSSYWLAALPPSKIVKFFTKSATNGSRPFQPSGSSYWPAELSPIFLPPPVVATPPARPVSPAPLHSRVAIFA
jgi:uncharacterized protein (DUF1800 family)